MSRKYSLACFFALASVALCLYKCISGAEWVTTVGLVLGVHGAANVVDKKFGGAG